MLHICSGISSHLFFVPSPHVHFCLIYPLSPELIRPGLIIFTADPEFYPSFFFEYLWGGNIGVNDIPALFSHNNGSFELNNGVFMSVFL